MITIIEPNYHILIPAQDILDMPRLLEQAGRTCYRSEDSITSDSAEKFVRMLCRNHHESVLEHCSISVRIVCSRACSHQLVRHRLASYSQESQRYVNYRNKGFQFICPPSVGLVPGNYDGDPSPYGGQYHYPEEGAPIPITNPRRYNWLIACHEAKTSYLYELLQGKPEDARYLLPNSSKTELVVTMNLRMWRHVFQERALNLAAQWEIRGIFLGIFDEFRNLLPCVFEDLTNPCS